MEVLHPRVWVQGNINNDRQTLYLSGFGDCSFLDYIKLKRT